MKIARSGEEKRRLLERSFEVDPEKENKVKEILEDVKINGDKAVFKLTRKYDKIQLDKREIEVPEREIETAYQALSEEQIGAIKEAAKRIKRFHVHEQKIFKSWSYKDNGTELGQLAIPIERIGCYIPGGRFPLPSSALMTIIPAKVAGVEEIIVCTPPKQDGDNVIANEAIAVAANIAGADKIYKIGGAQAIAAMAFGTESVPKVDKIVGPGSSITTIAKKLVYGYVDIDMLAGPSEVLIIADETANPEWVAADLLAQAEHDKEAFPLLITPSEELAKKVIKEIEKQLDNLPRKNKETASKSLGSKEIILTENLEECFEFANEFAPEHLEILLQKPEGFLGRVRNAGSIFLGEHSSEALGDYASGPNHVLPTGGGARTRGGLSVKDFLKFVSYQKVSKEGAERLKDIAATLARLEGLEAHARSVEKRE